METTFQRVRQTLADLFSLAPETVTLETSTSTVEAWDSMGHLMLIEALEQEFQTQFAPEESEPMTTVAKIVHTLESR
jgi:acyl carrier protein